MSMTTCKECSQPISSKAKSCPHCGARVRRTSLATWAITIFIGASVLMGIAANDRNTRAQAPLTETEIAAKAAEELRFQKTAIAAAKIKKALREPDSVVWEHILADDTATTICLQYRARNGFGGMAQEFAVFHKEAASQSADAWNKHCANRELHDLKHVRYALK